MRPGRALEWHACAALADMIENCRVAERTAPQPRDECLSTALRRFVLVGIGQQLIEKQRHVWREVNINLCWMKRWKLSANGP